MSRVKNARQSNCSSSLLSENRTTGFPSRQGWERQRPAAEGDVELGGEGDQRKPLASLYGTRPAVPGLKWTAR